MSTTLAPLNPQGLTPDALGQKLGPFGSWPENGLPVGYCTGVPGDVEAEFYREEGYLVVQGLFHPGELAQYKEVAAQICRNQDGSVKGIPSAPADMSDLDAMRRALCIHHPQKLSPTFLNVLKDRRVADILTKLIGPNVKAVQSMLFLKASGKPGQAWHQDEDFIPTRDRSLTGAWIALDDATVENGCLWILPGSQKRGLLWPQQKQSDRRFDCGLESFDFPWKDEDSIPVEVTAGSVVFFNGYLLHRSLPNRSATSFRRSIVNHYMSAESLLPWRRPEEGTPMALADFRDIVLVAGQDPFAYKGLTDIFKPHVRADGQGGCENGTEKK